jgi:PEP-CTERM motif
MKLGRVLILVLFALLFTGWLQADVDTSHFFISLNLDGSDCFNGIVPGTTTPCTETLGQGWAGAVITGVVNPGCPEEGCPTDSSVIVTCNGETCTGSPPIDPSGSTRLGGKSEPITPTFSVPVDGFGGGATDFQNDLGVPITTLELDFSFATDPPNGTEFDCSGGDAFDACGFVINSADLSGSIIFSGGHVTSTPEPSTWILLGTAALAIVGRRALRRA